MKRRMTGCVMRVKSGGDFNGVVVSKSEGDLDGEEVLLKSNIDLKGSVGASESETTPTEVWLW